MNTFSDNAIMLRVKAGELDQMVLLFKRYQGPWYGFLFHMTRQQQTTEDMVQTVFYRMLKYRHTFTGDGEFITWIYHVATTTIRT